MSELQEDLAAFAPRPRRTIRLLGQVYALRAFLDLTVEEALDVLHGEAEGQTGADRERALLHQVEVLVPELPKAVWRRLTPRQSRSVLDAASEGERDPTRPTELRLGFWFAQAARFYGWPWSEIRTMTLRQLQRFLSHAPELRARERMEEAMVAAFPHMEASGREALRRQWMGQAGHDETDSTPRVPWDQVRAFLGAKGNA